MGDIFQSRRWVAPLAAYVVVLQAIVVAVVPVATERPDAAADQHPLLLQ